MFLFHSIMPNEEVVAASFFLLYKIAILDDLITYSWAHEYIILAFKPMATK